MERRLLAGAVAVAAALLVPGVTRASEITIQNDSNTGFSPCTCFLAGEEVASWLTSPCAGTITKVQIGWGSMFGGGPDLIEMEVHLYRSGTFPQTGVEITSGEVTGPTLVDGVINEFDVSAVNATVTAGETFVASLELLNTSAPMGPAPLFDGDGCQAGLNAVFVLPGGWTDACPAGVAGDWVIRAVVDCACPADLDGTGSVGFSDLLQVIGAWGPCAGACPEDLSGNGAVDFADMLAVIGAWGLCP